MFPSFKLGPFLSRSFPSNTSQQQQKPSPPLKHKSLLINMTQHQQCPPHQQCLSRRTLPSYAPMRLPLSDSSTLSHTTCQKRTTSAVVAITPSSSPQPKPPPPYRAPARRGSTGSSSTRSQRSSTPTSRISRRGTKRSNARFV